MNVQRWLIAAAAIVFFVGFLMATGTVFEKPGDILDVVAVLMVGLTLFSLGHLP